MIVKRFGGAIALAFTVTVTVLAAAVWCFTARRSDSPGGA